MSIPNFEMFFNIMKIRASAKHILLIWINLTMCVVMLIKIGVMTIFKIIHNHFSFITIFLFIIIKHFNYYALKSLPGVTT